MFSFTSGKFHLCYRLSPFTILLCLKGISLPYDMSINILSFTILSVDENFQIVYFNGNVLFLLFTHGYRATVKKWIQEHCVLYYRMHCQYDHDGIRSCIWHKGLLKQDERSQYYASPERILI